MAVLCVSVVSDFQVWELGTLQLEIHCSSFPRTTQFALTMLLAMNDNLYLCNGMFYIVIFEDCQTLDEKQC